MKATGFARSPQSARLGAGRSLVRILSPRLQEKQVVEPKTAASSLAKEKAPRGTISRTTCKAWRLPATLAGDRARGCDGPSQIFGPPERAAPTNSSETASARDYLTLCPEQIQPYKAIYSWCGRGSQSLRTRRRYATTGACRSRWMVGSTPRCLANVHSAGHAFKRLRAIPRQWRLRARFGSVRTAVRIRPPR